MNRRIQADLALVFCTLIWGATFVVVKDALADSSVFAFLALRFAFAAVLMAVIFRRALTGLDRSALCAGAQIGCFMFAGYAFQTLGLRFTTPSKAAFITGSGVVMVPVLLAIFGARRVNRWVWTGAVAALAGLYFLTIPREGPGQLNRGDVLVLCCALMFAVHIILVGHHTKNHRVAALSFLQVATTAALTILALPLLAATRWEPPRVLWTGELIFAVGITAIGATAIAFSLQVWAQRYTTATHTAIILSLEPVFAALTSLALAHEHLAARALIGAALIFVGILIAELRGPTQAAPDSPGPVTTSTP